MPISLPLKLRWIGYRTGDCISCAITELGLENVQLIIIKRSLDPASGAITLTVRTEDPDKHARVFALTGDLPPVAVFERPDLPSDYVDDTQDQIDEITDRLDEMNALDAPSEFSGTQSGPLTVKLDWRNPKSAQFDHVVIVRNGVASSTSIVGGLGAALSATDAPPSTGTYSYRIRAFSTDGTTTMQSPAISVVVS